MDTDYMKREYETAKQHGFKGAYPNLPSDKEFSQQGEKFKDMMDRARQQKPEQTDRSKHDNKSQSQKKQRSTFLEK